MTLGIATIAFVLAAAFAGVAAAGYWRGAGWYVVTAHLVDGRPMIFTGPYASKEACEAQRPANVESVEYACEYLSTQPEWDD